MVTRFLGSSFCLYLWDWFDQKIVFDHWKNLCFGLSGSKASDKLVINLSHQNLSMKLIKIITIQNKNKTSRCATSKKNKLFYSSFFLSIMTWVRNKILFLEGAKWCFYVWMSFFDGWGAGSCYAVFSSYHNWPQPLLRSIY